MTPRLTAPVFGRIRHVLDQAMERLLAADERHHLADEIESLDEHLLRDIGITRTQASREARRLRRT
jgi:hypothetical protein